MARNRVLALAFTIAVPAGMRAQFEDGAAECGLDGGEVLESADGGAPVTVVGIGDLEPAIRLIREMGPDDDERGGISERRRPEEDGADDTEERGDGGDAECEGERRGDGGREVAAEPTHGEAEVEGCH